MRDAACCDMLFPTFLRNGRVSRWAEVSINASWSRRIRTSTSGSGGFEPVPHGHEEFESVPPGHERFEPVPPGQEGSNQYLMVMKSSSQYLLVTKGLNQCKGAVWSLTHNIEFSCSLC